MKSIILVIGKRPSASLYKICENIKIESLFSPPLTPTFLSSVQPLSNKLYFCLFIICPISGSKPYRTMPSTLHESERSRGNFTGAS